MAEQQLYTFDAQAQRQIAAAVRRLNREPRNRPGRDRQWPGYVRRGEQFGVTATCDEFPTYPLESAAPNTYVVKLQEWHFIEEPGAQSISKIGWSQYVVARIWNWTADTEYLPEGTPVHVWPVPTRRGIRWWMEAAEITSSSPPPPPSSESSSEPSSEPSSEDTSCTCEFTCSNVLGTWRWLVTEDVGCDTIDCPATNPCSTHATYGYMYECAVPYAVVRTGCPLG